MRDGEVVAADSVAGFLNWSCKVGSLAEGEKWKGRQSQEGAAEVEKECLSV